jgi:hypothetical protein
MLSVLEEAGAELLCPTKRLSSRFSTYCRVLAANGL